MGLYTSLPVNKFVLKCERKESAFVVFITEIVFNIGKKIIKINNVKLIYYSDVHLTFELS